MADIKNYGFKPPEPDSRDYRFGGATKLRGAPLSDGHWSKYAPTAEYQSERNFDTFGCTLYGTQNCLKFLFKFLFNENRDWSERYLAVLADSKPDGNDPKKIIETARTKGLIPDGFLPFNDDINSFVAWASPKPMTEPYLTEGRKFLDLFKLGYEWVNPKDMKEALKYSPLGVSVAAWYERDEKFYFPQGVPHNHWTCLFDYVENAYWLVFDSYDQTVKKIEWNASFIYVMRYSVVENNDLSILQQIINFLKKIVGIQTELVKRKLNEPKKAETVIPIDLELPPPAKESLKDLVIEMAEAIRGYEGWYPGSRSYRNFNPGNLKNTSYTRELGATGSDEKGFCIFPSYETGFNALCQFIRDAGRNKLKAYHDCSLYSFFQSYAPGRDGNIPSDYAEYVAKKINVSPTQKVASLL